MQELYFSVTDKAVTLTNKTDVITSGNIEYIHCHFDISEEYEGLTVRASFNGIYRPVINGECYAPILSEGICNVGVYGCELNDGKYETVISPQPTKILVKLGSFNIDDVESADIPPSEADVIYQAIEDGKLKGDKGEPGPKGDKGDKGADGQDGSDGQDGADGFSPIATAERNLADTGVIITITDKNGTTAATVYDGQGGTDLPITPLSLSPITSTALSSLADGTYIVTDEGTISTTAGGSISFVEGAIIAVQSDSGAKYASVINGLYAGYLSDQDDTEIELYAIPNDLENFVTQSDMTTALNLKANKATTYTKTEVNTLLDGKVSSSSVATIWTGTQNEYDAITTKDSDTLYFIVEANS